MKYQFLLKSCLILREKYYFEYKGDKDNKGKPENSFNIVKKNKNLKWLRHVTLKIQSLQNPHGTVSGV